MTTSPLKKLPLILAVSCFAATSTWGASLYWDTSNGQGLQPGDGTWSTTTQFWNSNLSDPKPQNHGVWVDGSDAVFQVSNVPPATSTVTVNGTVAANSITFTGSGYTIVGGISPSISLGGSGIVTTTSDGVINAPISGTAGLNKQGSSTLTLGGTNTYTGTTTVTAGRLLINGSTASGSTITVANGATLGGTGTVGGATTIQNGGNHTVGTAGTIGTQTFSSGVTYSSGSIFSWDLNVTTPTSTSSATTYDKVVGAASGSGATFAIVLAGGQSFSDAYWNASHTWTDVFSSGTLNSIFTSFGGSVGVDGLVAGRGQFSFSGTTLTWAAIPEPSTALAGLFLAAGLLHRRRATFAPRLA